jgi:hypothetical protein
MKIETKFNIGDEVFVLVDTKLEKRKIHSLKVEVEKIGQFEIKYWFRLENECGVVYFESKSESMIFASKDEFLNQLDLTE